MSNPAGDSSSLWPPASLDFAGEDASDCRGLNYCGCFPESNCYFFSLSGIDSFFDPLADVLTSFGYTLADILPSSAYIFADVFSSFAYTLADVLPSLAYTLAKIFTCCDGFTFLHLVTKPLATRSNTHGRRP